MHVGFVPLELVGAAERYGAELAAKFVHVYLPRLRVDLREVLPELLRPDEHAPADVTSVRRRRILHLNLHGTRTIQAVDVGSMGPQLVGGCKRKVAEVTGKLSLAVRLDLMLPQQVGPRKDAAAAVAPVPVLARAVPEDEVRAQVLQVPEPLVALVAPARPQLALSPGRRAGNQGARSRGGPEWRTR